MTSKYRVTLAAFAAFVCLASAHARPPVPISHPAPGKRLVFDTRKFMPVSEVRPGMRGYALTVFKGTKIEKFNIEVLGIINKFYEGKDYILFRALDGPPVTRHLNIAHGMSGSPIYIKGRLVGAISMGIPGTQFPKDPIALATPIEDMFDAWSPDLPAQTSPISATEMAATGPGGIALSRFQPEDMPLMVSGMGPRGIARLNSALAPYHFTVLAGGGAAGEDAANPLGVGAKLVPGAAVGVSLVQGDIDMTATGTVTYRDGNRVLLFGHPLAGLGPIDAAMTTAYVVDIFPSYQDSIKLGSPIKTVGRIFQDRPFSVGGVVGPMPQMIPMTVSVDDESIKRHKVFHVRIINHPLLTGQFVSSVAGEAISQIHGQPGDSIARVSLDVDVDEIGHVKRTNTFFDAVGIDNVATEDLDSLMRLLASNSFYPLTVKSVKMAVTIQNRHDTAEIDHIFLKQSKFAPGDTVEIGVALKPFKREQVIRTLQVKIPASAPDGKLTLSVRGGSSEGGGGGGGLSIGGLVLIPASAPSGGDNAATVGQLVRQWTEKPSSMTLTARLTLPTSAISIRGEKMSLLPPTLAGVMESTHSTGLKTERDEVKTAQTTPYIVSGSESLTITVQTPGSPAPAAPTATAPASPPSPSTASADTDGSDTDTTMSQGDDSTAPAALPNMLDTTTPALPAKRKPSAIPVPTAPTASVSGDANTPDSSVTPSVTPITSVKTVGRLASVWRQGTAADFAAGTLKNAVVTSAGDVRLAPSLHKVAETSETYFWALQPDGHGSVYAGSGDRGIIYKIGADGKAVPFFKTGELEVTSLAMANNGILYAGTAPHGKVFQITPTGQGHLLFTAKEKYVTALAYDATRQRVYVATGGGTGRVYKVDTIGSSIVFTSPETHLLSLALDKDGNVYAGSSPNGLIYKITPDGAAKVLTDEPVGSVSALATDSLGNLYAGTTPSGAIYKISPNGAAKTLYSKATSSILSLRADDQDNIYACAGSNVYKISADETVQSFATSTDVQFVSLAVEPGAGRAYVGTSTVGALYEIGAPGTGDQGTFQSVVHDAGAAAAQWGTLTWTPDTPPGTQIALQTRTGNTEHPDPSWSAWSAPSSLAGGAEVASPPGRYLQYQATLTGSPADADVPKLRDVTVYYMTRNQPPIVRLVTPRGGEAVSKTAVIQWAASDPDRDTLTYNVSYSNDGGKTWLPIKKSSAPASSPLSLDQQVAQGVARIQADLARHPELAPGVRKQVIAQAPDVIRQSLVKRAAQTAADASALKDTSYSWDTTQVPDGAYQIQVVASDRISNPIGALTAKAQSSSFLVANAPPTFSLAAPVLGGSKTLLVRGVVKTTVAYVKAVQYRVDSGDALPAVADDGLFDSTNEPFTLVTPPLASGAHVVSVQAIDRAGNTATARVSVSVP